MKKIYALAMACLFGGTVFAQHQVTFQVDMSGQTVDPDGVHVAGDFQAAAGASGVWQAGETPLTQVGTSDIYAVTVTIPAGNYQYKFINGNAWGKEESVPAESQLSLGMGFGNGSDNRWAAVMGDTTLPAVMFGGNAPANMTNLTLLVDMSTQANVEDTVSVAGSFQGWAPGNSVMADFLNDSLYRYVTYVPLGTVVDYKYINGTDWSQNETVPSACEVGGNRQVTVNSDMVEGPVCFGACGACFIPDTFNVTIQVDMNNVCGFTDSLDIAGPFNGWPGGFDAAYEMTDADSDGIYEITVRAAAPEFTYKARYQGPGGTNWEGSPNNVISFSGDTILPVRCYSSAAYTPCVPNPDPADLTFVVDVSTYPAQADLNDIYVIGDFTTPQWQDGKVLMTPVAGSPGRFEATVQDVCPGKIQYKFMNVTAPPANAEVEESFAGLTDSSCVQESGTGGLNREFVRPDDQHYVLSFNWNECTELGIGLEENSLGANLNIYPNPVLNVLNVELPARESFNIRMMDITGAVVRQISDATGHVRISKDELPAGVYILNVKNTKGAVYSSKVMIK